MVRYQRMLENENFADVTFVVGDTKVKAHKCILASRSNFFENMFSVGMREAQESGAGAATLNGRLIDAASIRQAEQIIEQTKLIETLS